MTPQTLPSRWRELAEQQRKLGADSQAHTLEYCADELEREGDVVEASPQPETALTWTWREKLWIVPAETRLGTAELAEALGKPKSWIYARTQADAEDPLPHRKLDSALTFTVGEVRAWIREREDVLVAGPMESTEAEKRGLIAV